MNRFDKTFERLALAHEKALVGFVTAGDPDLPTSMKVIRAMCEGGLDILELGVAFSDPTADGPVIQRSSQRALMSGMTVSTAINMAAAVRETCDIPIVLFSYYNPLLAYGAERLYKDATAAGIDGLLVVDLPVEESGELTDHFAGDDLCLIRLVAPTTPPERMEMIAKKSAGFIYVVSMTGVTGSGGLSREVVSNTTLLLKGITKLPVCVGFGISTPDHVAAVVRVADGVVVGSAFERVIESNAKDPGLPEKMRHYVGLLKRATRLG